MLDFTGDILNWLAAGVMFPLMLLPLAALAGNGRQTILPWLAIVAATIFAGVVFIWATPILSIAPSVQQGVIFSAMTVALGVILFSAGGAATVTQRLAPAIKFIVQGAGRAVMWLLLAMAFVQFGVVVLRYVFGINYIFMQESITYMHGAVFLLAGGYALLTDDHVRVDIFYGAAPQKRKALINFLGTYLLLFPVCLLLLWTSSPYIANSWAVGEGSTETSGIQGVFILKSFIPAFAVLLAMAGFNIAASAAAILKERS